MSQHAQQQSRLFWFLRTYYFRYHRTHCVVTTVMALLLGVVSTLFAATLGPAIYGMVFAKPEATIALVDLLGENYASAAQTLLGISAISATLLTLYLPFFILGCAAVRTGLMAGHVFMWERCGERVAMRVRNQLVHLFLSLDPRQRSQKKLLDAEKNLAATIAVDVRMARDVSAAIIGGLTRELLQLLMMSVTLALLSPRLFAIFVGGIAPLTLLLKKLGRKLQQRASLSLDNYATMTEWLQQRLLGIETIKHYRTENLEHEKFTHLSQEQFKIFLRTGKLQAIIPQLTEALTVAAMAVALYFALQELQHTSTALVLAFFSTLALFAQSASRVGRYFNQTREGNAAIVRVFALKTALEQNTCTVPLLAIESGTANTLVCDNITVQLAQQTVLRNFSYRFEGGKLYGLHGVVGAGKSTLLKAVLGLLPLHAGRIFLQRGTSYRSPSSPLSSLSLAQRSTVALWLPQKLQLRAGDTASNVCYPHTEADSERLEQALTNACVPREKWQVVIDYEHAKLSGGQEQRLGIARLFYHHVPLVLIDEGTSALDQQTEQQVLHNLKTLVQRGTIVIMAAHRSVALAVCDQLVEISPESSSS